MNFEAKGGYKIEEKLSKVCDGLGLDKEYRDLKFQDLSGGEKTTVLLGKVLLEEPDILLLDEPTNHLDMDSIDWLEAFLLEYRGTIIAISHDRYFLDRVINKEVELNAHVTDFNKLNDLYMEKIELESQLDRLLERWIELNE